MKIGDRVTTEFGDGNIVGIDLPYSDAHLRRWIVQIDAPKPQYVEMVARFKDNKLCFFKREVTKCDLISK